MQAPPDLAAAALRSETARMLEAVHPRFGFSPAVAVGPGWHRFAELGERIPVWVAELRVLDRAPSEIAMSLLSGLTGPVVRPMAAGFVLLGRVPTVTAETVAVHRRGRIVDRAALTCPIAAREPLLGADVVPDLAEELALRLAGLVTPVIDALHGATRFGRRNLWGSLGDVLSSHALWVARHRGDPEPAAREVFAEIQGVADRVQELSGVRFPRPVPYPVHGPSRSTLSQIRGTCCLHYRIPGRTAPDGTPRYCGTCPLLTEDARRERMRGLVEPATGASRPVHLG